MPEIVFTPNLDRYISCPPRKVSGGTVRIALEAVFEENPKPLLEETNSLIVCPSCLAEKPMKQTVELKYQGETFHFCKCPHCMTVFQEDPEYYIKRLNGEIEYSGVFSGGRGCCT